MIFAYIIAGLFAFIVVTRIIMMISLKRRKGKPAPKIGGAPGKAIESGNPTLFYFYTPTCPPCRHMTPLVDELSTTNQNVFKINVAEDMKTARKFGILGTPSVVLIKDKNISEFLMGPQSKERLTSLLNQ